MCNNPMWLFQVCGQLSSRQHRDPGFFLYCDSVSFMHQLKNRSTERAYTLFKNLGLQAIDLTSPALVKRVTPKNQEWRETEKYSFSLDCYLLENTYITFYKLWRPASYLLHVISRVFMNLNLIQLKLFHKLWWQKYQLHTCVKCKYLIIRII